MSPTDPVALDFDLAVMVRGTLAEAAAAQDGGAASPLGEGVLDANDLTGVLRF